MILEYSLEDIETVAEKIVSSVESKVLLFYGDMGVGKTTLIKALVKAIGSDDDVNSPTFSIVNEYQTATDTIYHFDLYRISNIEEAYSFGIEDYFNSSAWILVEWPNIIESIIPENQTIIKIKTLEDNRRIIKIGS